MTIGVFTIGFRIFTLKIFLPLAIIPIPLCILSDYVVEKLGSGFGGVLSGWSSRRATLRETFAADLAKARYSKRQGRFKEALSIIENVLDRDPEFPDALYLRPGYYGKVLTITKGRRSALKR